MLCVKCLCQRTKHWSRKMCKSRLQEGLTFSSWRVHSPPPTGVPRFTGAAPMTKLRPHFSVTRADFVAVLLAPLLEAVLLVGLIVVCVVERVHNEGLKGPTALLRPPGITALKRSDWLQSGQQFWLSYCDWCVADVSILCCVVLLCRSINNENTQLHAEDQNMIWITHHWKLFKSSQLWTQRIPHFSFFDSKDFIVFNFYSRKIKSFHHVTLEM